MEFCNTDNQHSHQMRRCKRCGCICYDGCSSNQFIQPENDDKTRYHHTRKVKGQRRQSSRRFFDHLRHTTDSHSTTKNFAQNDNEFDSDEYVDIVVPQRRPDTQCRSDIRHRSRNVHESTRGPTYRTQTDKKVRRPGYHVQSYLEMERRCRENPLEVVNPRQSETETDSDVECTKYDGEIPVFYERSRHRHRSEQQERSAVWNSAEMYHKLQPPPHKNSTRYAFERNVHDSRRSTRRHTKEEETQTEPRQLLTSTTQRFSTIQNREYVDDESQIVMKAAPRVSTVEKPYASSVHNRHSERPSGGHDPKTGSVFAKRTSGKATDREISDIGEDYIDNTEKQSVGTRYSERQSGSGLKSESIFSKRTSRKSENRHDDIGDEEDYIDKTEKHSAVAVTRNSERQSTLGPKSDSGFSKRTSRKSNDLQSDTGEYYIDETGNPSFVTRYSERQPDSLLKSDSVFSKRPSRKSDARYSDIGEGYVSTSSSIHLLQKIKPVQKMRAEWETKARDGSLFQSFEKRESAKRKSRSRSQSQGPAESSKLTLLENLEPLHYTNHPASIMSPRKNTSVETDTHKHVHIERSNEVTGSLRDSYIKSEDIKRLLKSDSLIETLEEDTPVTKTGKLSTASRKTTEIDYTKMKPFAEKWKGYHSNGSDEARASSKFSADGLSFLEFNEARQQIEAKTSKQQSIIDQKEEAITPPPTTEPRRSWWGSWGWGSTSISTPPPAPPSLPPPEEVVTSTTRMNHHDGKSSHSDLTRMSFAMAIETNRKTGKSKTLSASADDTITTMEGRATTLKVKESKLAVNVPFDKMKSVSQLDLTRRKTEGGLSHSKVYRSHSSEHFDLRCPSCLEEIDLKDVDVVSAHGYLWHSHCMICSVCNARLIETNSFYQDGQLYCVQHYAKKINAPKCAACSQYILEPVYTQAQGKTWHKSHFCCASCHRPIINMKFVLRKNDDVICFDCHETFFSHICAECNERIGPTEPFVFVKSTGTYWHATDACLHCHTCGQSLVTESRNRLIFVKNGILYCNKYCAQKSII